MSHDKGASGKFYFCQIIAIVCLVEIKLCNLRVDCRIVINRVIDYWGLLESESLGLFLDYSSHLTKMGLGHEKLSFFLVCLTGNLAI